MVDESNGAEPERPENGHSSETDDIRRSQSRDPLFSNNIPMPGASGITGPGFFDTFRTAFRAGREIAAREESSRALRIQVGNPSGTSRPNSVPTSTRGPPTSRSDARDVEVALEGLTRELNQHFGVPEQQQTGAAAGEAGSGSAASVGQAADAAGVAVPPTPSAEQIQAAANAEGADVPADLRSFCMHPYFQLLDSILTLIVLGIVYILVYHFVEVVAVFALLFWLFFANKLLKRHTNEKLPRRRLTLSVLVLTAAVLQAALYVGDHASGTGDRHLYLTLQKWDLGSTGLGSVLRITLSNDVCVVIAVIAIKTIFFLFCPSKFPLRRQRRVYVFIENLTRSYRALLPIPVWTGFLFGLESTAKRNLFLVLFVVHFGTQLVLVSISLATAVKAIKSLYTFEPSYGTYAVPEAVAEYGDKCAICHDSFTNPVRLDCDHIFCEDCLENWLAVRPTCPMCRAHIRNASQMPFSSGSTNWIPNPI